MSGFIAIAILVVVWLFVLAPLALRGQKPIRRTSDAFDKTRVVYEGGSGEITVPTGPKLLPRDVRSSQSVDNDAEEVPADDIVVDTTDRTNAVVAPPQDIDGEIVDSPATPEPSDEEGRAPTAEQNDGEHTSVDIDDATNLNDNEAAEESSDKRYSLRNYYLTPADLLHPAAHYETPEEETVADAATDDDSDSNGDEVTDADREFAARRRGRGLYDPEADASRATTRYERRQRTVIVLLAAIAVGLVLGIGFGGWWWIVPAVATMMTATYLAELRREVMAERALRRRRLRHLRRARMGVRTERDEAMGVPQRLRRPGAVVLEVDDDSPDFGDLPEIRYVDECYAEDDYVSVEPAHRFFEPIRRAG